MGDLQPAMAPSVAGGEGRDIILIPPTDATAPLVAPLWQHCCVTVQRVAEQPGCPCWSPGSGYRQKRHCKSWRRGQQCLWRCRGGHPVWPGCSRWSETKRIRSNEVLELLCFSFVAVNCYECSEQCAHSKRACWAACPSHLANLGDSTGLFPDCEASTEHLSPGEVLSGRVGGQSDRTQSNQIRVPERAKRG